MAYAQRILVIFSFKIGEDIQNVYIDVVHQYHTVYICVALYIRCLKIHQTKCHITYSMVGKKNDFFFVFILKEILNIYFENIFLFNITSSYFRG